MNKIALLFLLLPLFNALTAQDFKNLAAEEIEAENYVKAVEYLEQYVSSHPNDAEAWYRLGHCLHWLSYDSAPLPGFDQQASDRILECMRKALALNPHLRNCYSVIGSEYGARAQHELRLGSFSGFIDNLRRGRKAGGYPDWLLEYARNILNSCSPDAILFTGGDAEVFPIWYCQYVDGIRTDVSLAPVPLLDRPWFLLVLKSGVSNSIRPVAMPWTREQIMDMHVSKWSNQVVDLPIPLAARLRYGSTDSLLHWPLPPDLQRDDRSLLSIHAIVTLGLLWENKWRRPVHFSLGCHSWMLFNLNDHLQLHAMTNQLVPFHLNATGRKINLEVTIPFLTNPANFRQLGTLSNQDIPYLSAPLNNYRSVYFRTCDSLFQRGDLIRSRQLFECMETNVPADVLPMPDGWRSEINDLRTRIKKSQH